MERSDHIILLDSDLRSAEEVQGREIKVVLDGINFKWDVEL